MTLTVLRKEMKYVIYKHEFAVLRGQLGELMSRDTNGGDFGYTVRSLYYDSIYDDELYATVDGLLKKSKIRLRTYGGSSVIKLELKQKDGADSLKESLTLTKDEAYAMQECDYGFLALREEPVARKIYMQLMRGAYQPKTLVEYEREAYTYPVGNIRVTFDTDVKATASGWDIFSENPPWTTIIPSATGVLEVKYSTILPSFIKAAVETGSLSMANSKYAQSRLFYQ